MRPFRLYLSQLLFALLPPTRFFAVKRILLRWCGADIGSNVNIVSSARFRLTGRLVIGSDTWVGHDVLIVGGDAPVLIGVGVDIGPRVTIMTGSHEMSFSESRVAGKGYSRAVVVGDGAWLGGSSTILGGVTIGKRSVVAAGALVCRDVPPSEIVAGVPARASRGPLKRGETL